MDRECSHRRFVSKEATIGFIPLTVSGVPETTTLGKAPPADPLSVVMPFESAHRERPDAWFKSRR